MTDEKLHAKGWAVLWGNAKFTMHSCDFGIKTVWLDHVSYGLPCATPSLIFYKLISNIVYQSKSNQVYCHILQENVYMNLTIHSLCQQHIEQ